MAENFWIKVTPKRDHLSSVLASLFDALLSNKWTLDSMLYHDGGDITDLAHPTKEKLLQVGKGQATFRKQSRHLAMDIDFQEPGSILLGGDITFFQGTQPLVEMRGILGDVGLPDGTRIRGDLEGFLEMDHPPWYYWIAQFDPAKWRELLAALPESKERELGRVGESHLVMLSDSPYGRADNLIKLIRLIGDSRPRPNRAKKR